MSQPKSPPQNPSKILPLDRRRFLYYVGAGAASLLTRDAWAARLVPPAVPGAFIGEGGRPAFTPRRHPVPLPSDLHPPAEDRQRLAAFAVIDDLVLPEGFAYRVLAQWGDVFGPVGQPEKQVRFGYNNDYTGLVPIAGQPGHYYLMVNHEYVAVRPWLQAYAEVFGTPPPALELLPHPKPEAFTRGLFRFDGFAFDGPLFEGNAVDWANPAAREALPPELRAKIVALAERVLSQVGICVLHVRRLDDGSFEVVRGAADHRRITAIGRENVAGTPREHSRFTGPAAPFFARPPAGTMTNCSGGTTPWGTFLTCEENFYNEVAEEVSPAGLPLEDRKKLYGALPERLANVPVFGHPLPPTLTGNGHVLAEPLDGREYGWVCEVDPRTGHLRKHTALGRFRHENVALRCEAGKRLAAYMGDDRRGGHVWKFVSDGVVKDPRDPANSRLLEQGTLYVARFEPAPGYGGAWIPLRPETPLRRPEPEQCFTQHVQVPSRFVGGPVAVGDPERDHPDMAVEDWMAIVESYVVETTGRPRKFAEATLGDLVAAPGAPAAEVAGRKQGVLLMDAFLMANTCGGTPSARPEDLEVHPFDRTVYIAFTENAGSSDGSPDRRIFPDSDATSSRQYGAIYRLLEGGVEGPDSDPAATTFTWGRFLGSGEVAEKGAGFGFADNLVFDPQGHLWMVTDITTTAQNFPTGRNREDASQPGGLNFPGIFGNNAMFAIPTHGENAGMPYLFATGPMDSELCGPTFSEDGRTLILSVQHPGELDGMATSDRRPEEREHQMLDRDGRTFVQKRQVPIGSNFPHGQKDRAPRPAVVSIQRKT